MKIFFNIKYPINIQIEVKNNGNILSLRLFIFNEFILLFVNNIKIIKEGIIIVVRISMLKININLLCIKGKLNSSTKVKQIKHTINGINRGCSKSEIILDI